MMDEHEPIFERAIGLPFGYVITARARPSTVKRTALRLLPWAVYLALPQGRGSRLMLAVARRVSPLIKPLG
jgi:hypothetical protein